MKALNDTEKLLNLTFRLLIAATVGVLNEMSSKVLLELFEKNATSGILSQIVDPKNESTSDPKRSSVRRIVRIGLLPSTA